MDDYVGHLREFRRILRNLESQSPHPVNRETLVALSQKLDRDASQLNADRLESSIRATVEATGTLEELSDYEEDLLAVLQEIVARKRGELERARFRKLLDRSAECIFIVEPSTGRLLDVNETAARTLGYSRDELLERAIDHVEEGLPVMPAARRHHWVEQVRQSGENVFFDGVHRRKDGSRLSVEVSASVVDVDGQHLLLLVSRDVTERKRAEARLKRQWSFFSRLAQRSLDGIVAFDRNLNVTYWNPAMERLLGERKSKVLGKNLFQAIPQLREMGEERHFRDALAGSSSSSRDRSFVHGASGREVRFEGYYSPLTEENGEIFGGIGILRDVSERREHELRQVRESLARADEERSTQLELARRLESELAEQKRENERLRRDRQTTVAKSVDAARAERVEGLEVLARGIAREVEPLMAGILGQTGVALAELPTSSPLRRGVEEIEEAALSANDIATTLAAFCGNGGSEALRIEPGRLVHELEHTLEDALAGNVSLVLPEVVEGEAAFRGDPRHLRELLVALVANASDAMAARGGTVRVTTGTLTADDELLGRAYLGRGKSPGPYVYLAVEDTGEGMDEATQSRIFVPFFTTRTGRRGLGLARVLGIVRSHGGVLDVETAPGKGTTIRALFPAI